MRRSQLRSAVEAVGQAFGAAWLWSASVVTQFVGFDELVVTIALTLITYGLWPDFGVRALIVPGVVLLWIALPGRGPLVHRPAPRPEKPATVRRA